MTPTRTRDRLTSFARTVINTVAANVVVVVVAVVVVVVQKNVAL